MAETRPEQEADTHEVQPAHLEGARVLATEARLFLHGYPESQLLEWANTYIARMGSGDVRSFVEWIHLRRRVRGRTASSS